MIPLAGYGYPWQCAPNQVLQSPTSVPMLNTGNSMMSLFLHSSAMSLSSDCIPTIDSVQSNLPCMSIHASHSDLEKLGNSDNIDPALAMLRNVSKLPTQPQQRPQQPPPDLGGAELAPWSFMATPAAADTQGLTAAMSHALPTFAFDDLNQRWQYNCVHIPTTGQPWPVGIHARECCRPGKMSRLPRRQRRGNILRT